MTDLSKIFTYKAAIFDLDGTLVNSEPVHLLAWQDVCRRHGMKEPTLEFLQHVGGMTTVNMCRMMCEEQGLNLDSQAIAQEKIELYREKYMQQVTLFDEIAGFAASCHAKGIRTAVATGSHLPETRYLLEKHAILDNFDTIVSSDQVKHSKPAPDTYLEAARRLEVAPSDCLVFEDTVIGLQGIKAAGMTSLQVLDGRVVSDYNKP